MKNHGKIKIERVNRDFMKNFKNRGLLNFTLSILIFPLFFMDFLDAQPEKSGPTKMNMNSHFQDKMHFINFNFSKSIFKSKFANARSNVHCEASSCVNKKFCRTPQFRPLLKRLYFDVLNH